MNNPRLTGLLLLLIGVLVLVGNTLDVFPPQAFWAGLLMYPIGGYLFFIGSRRANEPEQRTRSADSRPERTRGEGQAARHGGAHDAPPKVQSFGSISQEIVAAARKPAEAAAASQPAPAAAMTSRTDAAPAGQPGGGADQLAKLNKLREQGIISAEELAVAKAKLRG